MNYNYEIQKKALEVAEGLRKLVPEFYYGFLMRASNIKPGICFRGNHIYTEITITQMGTLHMCNALHLHVEKDKLLFYVIWQKNNDEWLSREDCNQLVDYLQNVLGIECETKRYSKDEVQDWWTRSLTLDEAAAICKHVYDVFGDCVYELRGKETPFLYDEEIFTKLLQKHLGTTIEQQTDGTLVYIEQNAQKEEEEPVEEPALEPAIANYITQHDGETYTDEQLCQIAKEMREVVGMDKNQALHLFGMLYPEQIGSKSGQIAKNALNSDTLHIEIQKGIKLGKYLRSLIYNPNLLDFEVNSTDYTKYMRALRTKPFMLLAGISGTGKSRIVRELAFRSCPTELQDKDGTTPGNYLMVEVKPNWHDSSEILGYYSNISKHYQFTKFVEFLVKAHKHPETPFFVCMDEMNLAPVEQYFAEFLSVLETRKYPKDDPEHIKTGRLIEGKYMQELPAWGKNEDLTLPDNVFIIGTVNMDDTTHQFSRKVIDRAMTIEMNGEDLRKMFGGSKNMTYTQDWTLADFQPKYVQADEVVKKHGDMLKKDLPERLEIINKALAGTPFEVSYRVLNELCIYLGVLLDEHVPYQQAVKDAVDRILLMKILPRVEGDMEMFDLSKEERDAQTDKSITNKLEWLAAICKEDYPESYEKVLEMNKRLVNGFTRFWP